MVVGVFRRSLSFPNKNPNRPSKKPPISHHTRSISLPCRSHPLISLIKDEIKELTSWAASTSKPNHLTSTWLCDGLNQLKNVHDLFGEILQLPQARESLHRQTQWVDRLLEVFLRFVDVYGIFQTSILSLKEDHSMAQMAMRKRDEAKLALYVKSKKKMGREMTKLLSTVRCIKQSCTSLPALTPNQMTVPVVFGDTEMAGVISDVVDVTVLVSIALLNGIAASFASKRSSWTIELVKLSWKGRKTIKVDEGIKEFQEVSVESLLECRKKCDEEVRLVLKRMRDMESCICSIEGGSGRVFRALINSEFHCLTLSHRRAMSS